MKRKKKLQARSSSGVCDAPHVRTGRGTAVSPSTVPVSQPNHTTPHPTPPQRHMYTPAGKKASQAKPHQKHTQHKTTPQSRRHLSMHISHAASPILQQCLGPKALSPNSTFKRFTYIEKCSYVSQQHLRCHVFIVSKPRRKWVACWVNASLAIFHLPFYPSHFPSDPGLTALLPKNTSK